MCLAEVFPSVPGQFCRGSSQARLPGQCRQRALAFSGQWWLCPWGEMVWAFLLIQTLPSPPSKGRHGLGLGRGSSPLGLGTQAMPSMRCSRVRQCCSLVLLLCSPRQHLWPLRLVLLAHRMPFVGAGVYVHMLVVLVSTDEPQHSAWPHSLSYRKMIVTTPHKWQSHLCSCKVICGCRPFLERTLQKDSHT